VPAGTPTYSGGSVLTGALPAPSAGGGATTTGGAGKGRTRLAASRTHDVGNLAGNLPLGMVLLIPFVLLMAVLAGQSLTPTRARREHVRRQGGVGRALAARATRPVRRSRPEMP